MNYRHLVVAVVLVLVMGSLLWAAAYGPGAGGLGLYRPRDAVGIIYLDGVLVSGAGGTDLFGTVLGSDDIIGYIEEATWDPTVKALVLRINSPGGSAAAAEEIGRELEKFQAAGKVLVVSMGDVAASGAYWIAAGADEIIANASTITGSIGVIMQVQRLEELYEKIGVEVETIKSGPHKDIGSATRQLTGEEREILQSMVDDIFHQFVDVVAAGRDMTREQVLDLADGRIFTGRQAQKAGLVDRVGNFYDAIDRAAELAGITGEYDVIEYGRVSPLERLLSGYAVLAPGLDVRELLGRLTVYRHLLEMPK